MFLTYRPEGADERRWPFKPERLMSAEAEAIERQTGWTYEEFGERLIKGSVTARRALLWVMLKREEPTLRYSQVDVPSGSVALDYERHELEAIRDKVAENADLSEREQRAALASLDDLIAGMPEGVEAPKATASDAASSG